MILDSYSWKVLIDNLKSIFLNYEEVAEFPFVINNWYPENQKILKISVNERVKKFFSNKYTFVLELKRDFLVINTHPKFSAIFISDLIWGEYFEIFKFFTKVVLKNIFILQPEKTAVFELSNSSQWKEKIFLLIVQFTGNVNLIKLYDLESNNFTYSNLKYNLLPPSNLERNIKGVKKRTKEVYIFREGDLFFGYCGVLEKYRKQLITDFKFACQFLLKANYYFVKKKELLKTLEKKIKKFRINVTKIKSQLEKIDFALKKEEADNLMIKYSQTGKKEYLIVANKLYSEIKKDKRKAEHLKNKLLELEKNLNKVLEEYELLKNCKLQVSFDIKDDRNSYKSKKRKIKINKIKLDNALIFYGKNENESNELLKLAKSSDLWFHVNNFRGSHVILRGEKTKENIYKAAKIAAEYSKAGKGKVAVNYAPVANIHKVAGTKALVIYKGHGTIWVEKD